MPLGSAALARACPRLHSWLARSLPAHPRHCKVAAFRCSPLRSLSVATGRPGNGAIEPRERGDGPAWRDVLCQGFLWHQPYSLKEERFLSFLLAERKERKLGKERKEPLLLASGGQGGERRNCIARPALPSLDPPLSPALGLGLLAARSCRLSKLSADQEMLRCADRPDYAAARPCAARATCKISGS